MAQAYRLQGKLQEAEPFYKKALAIEEKSMSSNDQDHAITMFNLSLLYFQLEKYDKCEPLMVQSLAILKKTLGETNPDYLNVYKYYLALLRKTNRSQQADALESEAQPRQN
jgi:tetratricopeptide (TPR) repeat protein